jgi:hypothetical protein
MTPAAVSTVEMLSGKDTAYENFPVMSWLLPARLRPHIATFYRLVRAIDDITDNGNLPAAEKLRRLDAFVFKMVRRPLRAYVIGASCSRVHPQHDELHGCDGKPKRTSCRDQRPTS